MALVKKKRRGPGPARPVHARTKIDRSKLEVLPIGADSRRFGIFADRRESSRDKLRNAFLTTSGTKERKTFFETADALQERYFSTRTFSD